MSQLDVSMRLRLIDQLSGPARNAGRNIKGIEDAAKRLNGAGRGERLANELRKVGGAAKQADANIRSLDQHSRNLGNGRFSRLRARLGGVGAVSQEVASGLGMPGAALGVGRAGAAGGVVGGAIVGGVIALGVALKASVSQAIRFEDAMAEVKKAVDTSPEGFAELERQILKLSRVTPLAKEEIAQLVAQAGFAGRPAEELVRFAVFGAKAAKAFTMGAEETGDALANLGNIWKLNQDGIEDVANAINVLADSTASKERDIIDFMRRMQDVPKTFGLAKHETAAFGAAMLSLGTTPDVAATGLKTLLSRFQTATSQSKKFRAALRSIGLSAKGLEKDIQTKPLDALLEVLERISKVDPANRMKILNELGGGEYFDDLGRLVAGLGDLRKALQSVNDEAARAGSVEKSFRIFDELTSSKLEKAGNSFKALGVHIGKVFTPAIGAAADAVGGLLDKLNDLIENGGKSNGAQPKAPQSHPLISAVERQVELERELAAAQGAAAKGDFGAQNKAIALQAALGKVRADVEAAMKMPGAEEAAAGAMRAVSQAISTQGEDAVQAAKGIADRIKTLFNFTVTPTISPRFSPSGGGSSGSDAPLPPPKPRTMGAAATNRNFAQTNTINIMGGDPHATAREVERRLARLGSSSNALFDTA